MSEKNMGLVQRIARLEKEIATLKEDKAKSLPKKIITEKYDGPNKKPSKATIEKYRAMDVKTNGRVAWYRFTDMVDFWKGKIRGRRDKHGALRCENDGNWLPVDIKNGDFVYSVRRLTKEEKENLDPEWPDWSYGKKRPFFLPEGA